MILSSGEKMEGKTTAWQIIKKKCGTNSSSCPRGVKQEATGWDHSSEDSDEAQEKPFLAVRAVKQ